MCTELEGMMLACTDGAVQVLALLTHARDVQVHIDTSNARFDAFLQQRMDAKWTAARDDLLQSSMGPSSRDSNGAAALLPAPSRMSAGSAAARRALAAPPTPEVRAAAARLSGLRVLSAVRHTKLATGQSALSRANAQARGCAVMCQGAIFASPRRPEARFASHHALPTC